MPRSERRDAYFAPRHRRPASLRELVYGRNLSTNHALSDQLLKSSEVRPTWTDFDMSLKADSVSSAS
jgi:hypothetical protein